MLCLQTFPTGPSVVAGLGIEFYGFETAEFTQFA